MTTNPTCIHKWEPHAHGGLKMVKCVLCQFVMYQGAFRPSVPKAPEAPRIDSEDRPSIYSANLF